ncbi:MAG: glycosyltransferase [bacterium]|nr:glycosyltransferase [bacterium]
MNSPTQPVEHLVHLMHSLEVGGLEQVVLSLIRRARAEGLDHSIVVCDHAFRDATLDFDPGDLPVTLISRGPGLDWSFVRRLRKHLRQVGAQVVHAHNDTPIVYGALAGMQPFGKPPGLIGTFHNMPHCGGTLARRMTRWASGRARGLTSVSEELGQRISTQGWSVPPTVLENGVDLDRYQPEGPNGQWRERSQVADGEILVGMLARHVPVKRQADLLAAAKLLHEQGRPVHTLFVGQGPDREAFVSHSQATPGVTCLLPTPHVPDLLRALDIFVLCSDHEAMPLALMEAMAAGRACIVTQVGGMPDLISGPDGPVACMVPPRDPNALAEAIARLASDPALRTKLGGLARNRAASFAFDKRWPDYLRLWARATGHQHGESP